MRYMQENGFSVHMVSSPGPETEFIKINEGCSFTAINMTRKITPFKDLVSLYRLWRLIIQLRPAIVHTHTPKAGLLGMLAASLAGVPVRLHTVAGLPWMESKGLERFLLKQMEKATTSFSSRTYVNSAHLMAFMQQERLDPSFTKLKLLAGGSSNGIDSDYYNRSQSDTVLVDELKRKSRVSAKGFIWLFVGRLVGDKGISELVEAFSAVRVDHPNDQLWLVGPLETGHSLPERCIQAIENDPNIIHWGYQDDVRPFFAAAGALVFPSYREGFPNVPMQAAAMGCPMILSDINGCNEIVEHKKNGLLVPFKNARALYEAMVLMRNDDESVQQYVRLSLALIREKFDNKTIWKLIETEYRNLLSSNKD